MRTIPSVDLDLDRKRRWQLDPNAIVALHDVLGDDAMQQIAKLGIPPEDQAVFDEAKKSNPDLKMSEFYANPPEGFKPAQQATGPQYRIFRALLWAGLVSDDPNLTLVSSGSLWRPGDIDELMRKIIPAFNDSLSRESPKEQAKFEQSPG
jgi:hypothetical protein